MTERPIIFSGPMVRAILDGRKHQTRRVVKKQPHFNATGCDPSFRGEPAIWWDFWESCRSEVVRVKSPCAIGDRLWVRETWCHTGRGVWTVGDAAMAHDGHLVYRATDDDGTGGWFPSIHMPKWAARIWLEVTGVRVERLQDISEEDVKAEGAYTIQSTDMPTEIPYYRSVWEPDHLFSMLWDHLNAKRAPWASNPWVWVIEFRRVND